MNNNSPFYYLPVQCVFNSPIGSHAYYKNRFGTCRDT